MRRCPSCGFVNPPERERCLKCSTLLVSRELPTIKDSALRERSGISPMTSVNRLAYAVGRLFSGDLPEGVPYRWVWTAAFLSFLPGGGAWYNHQPRKAAVFATIQLFLLGLFVYTIFMPINDLWAAVLAAWMFYALADGFVTAARLNGTAWRVKHFVAVWFAMMFFVGSVTFLMNYFGQGFFLTTNVRTNVQSPAFEAGDRVFVLTPWLAGTPRQGAVVYYDPGAYQLKSVNAAMGTEDTTIVNEKSAFGVVTAIGGQMLSTGPDGVIRVDRQPVPPGLLPANPNGAAGINERVPPGHFGILMTHGAYEGGLFAIGGMMKGHGGVYGVEKPGPREAARAGFRVQNYSEAVMTPEEKIFGVALFRYYPPERRTWWGLGGPLWKSPPADYPRPD